MQSTPKTLCRLTLTPKAFAFALHRQFPVKGFTGRPDGNVDVVVKSSVFNLLQQLGRPKENLSDVVIRELSNKESV